MTLIRYLNNYAPFHYSITTDAIDKTLLKGEITVPNVQIKGLDAGVECV